MGYDRIDVVYCFNAPNVNQYTRERLIAVLLYLKQYELLNHTDGSAGLRHPRVQSDHRWRKFFHSSVWRSWLCFRFHALKFKWKLHELGLCDVHNRHSYVYRTLHSTYQQVRPILNKWFALGLIVGWVSLSSSSATTFWSWSCWRTRSSSSYSRLSTSLM